ncbi:MAG TPA: hypothetical protein VGR86_06665, partial [Steroidobacteraceae bacterium]|nr:hypothetical protein [Steroidobacteraceae bacterium]
MMRVAVVVAVVVVGVVMAVVVVRAAGTVRAAVRGIGAVLVRVMVPGCGHGCQATIRWRAGAGKCTARVHAYTVGGYGIGAAARAGARP